MIKSCDNFDYVYDDYDLDLHLHPVSTIKLLSNCIATVATVTVALFFVLGFDASDLKTEILMIEEFSSRQDMGMMWHEDIQDI